MNKKKVLVLGRDTKSFLAVIRSLGRKGIEVHIGWCPITSPSIYSKYVKKVHFIPPYSPTDEKWKEYLTYILCKEQFDLVIPTDDPSIIPLQFNKSYFQNIAKIYLLDDKAFRITWNKYETYNLAKMLDIPLPKQAKISSLDKDELKKIVCCFGFPLVLKPIHSFTPNDIMQRKNVKIISDISSLKSFYKDQGKDSEILVQEYFPGIGTGIEVLAYKGKILTLFQHIRIHEPPYGGESTYRKSIRPIGEMVEAVIKMIKELNYTGVGMFEFRIDPSTNKWILLEINGRFWGSLPLAIASGVDFPYYLYELIVENRKEFPKNYKIEVFCRNLTSDLEWMISVKEHIYKNRKLPWLFLFLPKIVWEFIENLFKGKEHSDTFVLDDLKPGVKDFILWIKKKFISLKVKLIFKLYSIRIVRRLMRLYIVHLIKRNKHIVFICFGNIIRSPFSEYYAKKILPSYLSVMSCGLHAKSGNPCPPNVIAEAKKYMVNLKKHKALNITEVNLNSNKSIIFLFDKQNYKELILHKIKNIFPLGIFSNDKNIEIKDPNKNDIFKVFCKITKCLNNLNDLIIKYT